MQYRVKKERKRRLSEDAASDSSLVFFSLVECEVWLKSFEEKDENSRKFKRGGLKRPVEVLLERSKILGADVFYINYIGLVIVLPDSARLTLYNTKFSDWRWFGCIR